MRLSRRFPFCTMSRWLTVIAVLQTAGCDDSATQATPCATSGPGGGTGGAPIGTPQGQASLFVEVYDESNTVGITQTQVGVNNSMLTSNALGQLTFDNLPTGQNTLSFFASDRIGMRMATFLPDVGPEMGLRARMRVLTRARPEKLTCKFITGSMEPCIAEFNDVKLTIPAHVLRDATNTKVSGEFDVFLSRFLPDKDLHLLPGSVQTSDTNWPLRVWTLASIEAWQGNLPLELLEGQTADVEMLIPNAPNTVPEGMASHVQDTITAKWQPTNKPGIMITDAAQRRHWKTTISQLGLHAAAQRVDKAMTVTVAVKNAEGAALPGVYVQLTSRASEQEPGKGQRSHVTGFTGKEGSLDLRVPEDQDAEPFIDVRLPGLNMDGKPEWQLFADGKRSLVVKLAGVTQGEACAQAGEKRVCGDQNVPVTCHSEYQFCNGQVWGPCAPQAQQLAEICNGIDDDCDGVVDGPLTQQGVPCGTGKPGICSLGQIKDCVAGKVMCEALKQPEPESCDGLDNDCDGEVDEEVVGVGSGCTPIGNQSGKCSTGTTVCQDGVSFCKADSGTPEECNGVDDDCDGVVDNGFGTITCGQGACLKTIKECDNGVPQTVCTPEPPSSPERCANQIDDDCDGLVDEPAVETCNGVDDDCDGNVDDGLGTIKCGIGACEVTVDKCANGKLQECEPGPKAPMEKCFDGIDDDCNGEVDDGCCDATQSSCPTSPEICDGIDNDRDGRVNALDDDLVIPTGNPPGYRCCPTNGGVEDLGDKLDNDCNGFYDETPGCQQNIEMPDGDDDNCNGYVDENTQGCVINALEICDGVDQNCDGVADEGLCCDAIWNNNVKCTSVEGYVSSGLVDLVHDSGIVPSQSGNLQIMTGLYAINQYLGARYLLPMKKGLGQKNRWYWEVAVSTGNSSNDWCIGIGTAASPMVVNGNTGEIGNCIKPSVAPANQAWAGAVVSVLLDLAEGKLWYWLNGVPTPLSTPVDPNATYYPMTWIHSNSGNVLTHNFGPTFRYPISDLFQAPQPATP